jgi:asparagine synthetase B (glutamine-hydrolysing)
MCSISGFLTKNPLDPIDAKRLCTALLWYGQERGQHSAGVYFNKHIIKDAVHPSKFISSKEFMESFSEGVSLAICHTRQPTSGGREALHAQPFMIDSTVTAHNGMLWDCEKIKKRWELKKKTDVDSELFTRFIDEYGVLRLPEFVESTAGNSALAIMQSDKLYLFRDGNPLCFISFDVPGNEVFAFGSTADILMSALKNIWLIPPSMRPAFLDDGILHIAESSGVHALTKKRASHTWQNGGRHWESEEGWERRGNTLYRKGAGYTGYTAPGSSKGGHSAPTQPPAVD